MEWGECLWKIVDFQKHLTFTLVTFIPSISEIPKKLFPQILCIIYEKVLQMSKTKNHYAIGLILTISIAINIKHFIHILNSWACM